MLSTFHDFTLTLLPGGNDYLVTASCPALAGEAGPEVLTAKDGARLLKYGQNLSGESITDITNAVQIGKAIYDTVFPGEIGALFQQALVAAAKQASTAGLRLVIKAKRMPELHEIPWELLSDDGKRFLARLAKPVLVITRYIEQPNPVKTLRVPVPLRVLFTTACPPAQSQIDVKHEEKLLRQALEPLGARVRLEVVHHVSLSTLRQMLLMAQNRGKPYHVWHHCGHGGLDSSNQFVLVLEDEGAQQLVHTDEINSFVSRLSALRLAILNVCHGTSAFGLGTNLAALNVPAVVGFRSSVLDQAALRFAEAFYDSLTGPLDVAVWNSREALRELDVNRPVDWALPLLFLRAQDSVLLDANAAEPPTGGNVQITSSEISAAEALQRLLRALQGD